MEKETKQKLHRRLKIIEGQVRGIQKMIDADKYCVDVITQSSAVRHSLSSIEDILMENHLKTCATEQIRGNDSKKAISEIINIYKLAKKK